MIRPARDNSFWQSLPVSLLLHLALLWLVVEYAGRKQPQQLQTPMINLADVLVDQSTSVRGLQEVERKSDQRRRVLRESAPRGGVYRERIVPPAVPKTGGETKSPQEARQPVAEKGGGERATSQVPSEERSLRSSASRREELARLFPGASNLAAIEENYRRKYAAEVEENDTTFLNTDDIQFGSFLRRFENAVYGVWRYPQEAARLGVEGVTAVRITFNRRGEVARYEVLEGSGSRMLDDEVGRVLRTVGPMGTFPRGYDKEEYHLIAFFRYAIVGGTIRGTLR